jgi:crossover junction endodeoxyribonuclease RuvC
MRILGIDPGSEATGYGIIDTDGFQHRLVLFGAIKTNARRPFQERLLKIHKDLSAILSHERAEIMAIEEVFHAANVQSALKLGHARGVALLVAAVVGYGRAEKTQIQAMVRVILSLPEIPSPDDAADALAVAICHAHHLKSTG